MSDIVDIIAIDKSPFDLALLRKLINEIKKELEIDCDITFIIEFCKGNDIGECFGERTVLRRLRVSQVFEPMDSFIIKVQPNSKFKFIETLLHEMRHVWQHFYNKCKINDREERQKEYSEREFEIDAKKWANENAFIYNDRMDALINEELRYLRRQIHFKNHTIDSKSKLIIDLRKKEKEVT